MYSTTNKTHYAKYCKVCFDAKKTQNIYTSHNVRDLKSGVTICPTLLSQDCRYCHKSGHTVKFCKEAEQSTANKKAYANQQSEYLSSKPEKLRIAPALPVLKQSSNAFDTLCDSSSSSEGEEEEEQQALAPEPQKRKYEGLTGYASALLTKAPKELANIIVVPNIPQPKPLLRITKIKTSWADAVSDSTGSDEE